MAVNAVRNLGYCPEDIAVSYDFERSCIYRWLKQYDECGFEALESKMPPGAYPLITIKTDEWLKNTVLESTPIEFCYDTNLWTCTILADLLKQEFNIAVSDSTVRLHLKAMNLSCQKPEYQDITNTPKEKDGSDERKLVTHIVAIWYFINNYHRLYLKHAFDFLKINKLTKSKNRFSIKSNDSIMKNLSPCRFSVPYYLSGRYQILI